MKIGVLFLIFGDLYTFKSDYNSKYVVWKNYSLKSYEIIMDILNINKSRLALYFEVLGALTTRFNTKVRCFTTNLLNKL